MTLTVTEDRHNRRLVLDGSISNKELAEVLDPREVLYRLREHIVQELGKKVMAKLGPRRPNPNSLPCVDCGHLGDDRRHEYDHHLGYEAEHHYDVQPVCSKCHAKRDGKKAKQTHCINGHEFTPENTIIKSNGCRQCRECRKAHDRKRVRDAAYWRAYRAKRREL